MATEPLPAPERITRIEVAAFRGVPERFRVELPGARSLVIFGDNGTGKSTIADALEWFFTGKISFLSHEGRRHAVRHLGANEPTWVEVETTGTLGGKALHPHDAKTPAVGVGTSEMFQLRGRALVEFIDKTKGEKWKELANILGFEAANQLALELQRVRNDLETARVAADANVNAAVAALARLGVEADEARILEELSELCAKIGAQPPATTAAALDPNWTPSLTRDRDAALAAGRRAALAADIAALTRPELDRSLLTAWNEVIGGETDQERVHRSLLKAADSYFDSVPDLDKCPICGHVIDAEVLRKRVSDMLGELAAADQRFRDAEEGVLQLTAAVKAAEALRNGYVKHARELGAGPLGDMPTSLSTALERARKDRSALNPETVDDCLVRIAAWDSAASDATRVDLEIGEDNAGSTLSKIVTTTEQLRQLVTSRTTAAAALRAHSVSQRIFDAYQERLRTYFSTILDRITGRTSEIYGRLHPGEHLQDVRIEPWEEKGVELAVEFYGKQQRPPHGVLSESHLNSLAIALFLAMAETFNHRLGFLVLDDVINSFDTEHRGRLADLLVTEFETRQLVVLTHDPLFYKRLTTLAPNWGRLELTSWSFEAGPRTVRYAGSATLAAARDDLANGDRQGAATKGRRALEELLQEICEHLEAELPFRRGAKNEHREYGEIMSGLRSMLRMRAPKLKAQLEPLLRRLDADVQAGLNVESHASQQRVSQQEVQDSLDRVEQLEETFTCPHCKTRVWNAGSPDSCRCKCAVTVFPPV